MKVAKTGDASELKGSSRGSFKEAEALPGLNLLSGKASSSIHLSFQPSLFDQIWRN